MRPIPINEALDGKIRIKSSAWINFFNDISSIKMGTPASASDSGEQGQMLWDTDYLYVCIAPSIWKRTALSSW